MVTISFGFRVACIDYNETFELHSVCCRGGGSGGGVGGEGGGDGDGGGSGGCGDGGNGGGSGSSSCSGSSGIVSSGSVSSVNGGRSNSDSIYLAEIVTAGTVRQQQQRKQLGMCAAESQTAEADHECRSIDHFCTAYEIYWVVKRSCIIHSFSHSLISSVTRRSQEG